MRIETLTIEEAMAIMRSFGVKISYAKLTAWADAGAVPWAISAPTPDGDHLRTIFKRPLMEWLESLATQEG
ncbi:MAG: hypothetical protein IKZ82_06240 [Clostridia bacterium]|nr:hypothetical protein [Clostridia bacterium]